MTVLTCFKACDIRGQLGSELNEYIPFRIGSAFAQHIEPTTAALGADIRISSESLKLALASGQMDSGVNVIDLGMTGTEEVYFAAQYLDIDAAIEITASHNPIDNNAMKLVKRNAVPISGDSGLNQIKLLAQMFLATAPGSKVNHDPRPIWHTTELVESAGGIAIQSKTGHAFIKERMRQENAIYGGEMSAIDRDGLSSLCH